jgi:dienelactone hydrolase
MIKLRRVLALVVIGALSATPAWAGSETDLPVAAADVPRGTGSHETSGSVAPTAKAVDGQITDWAGVPTMYGGTSTYSAGEFIYQDHLFDAYGSDDGRDAERMAILDPVRDEVPETYRVDALMQADVPGQLGAPTPEQLSYPTNYGDLDHQDAADLLELRVATDTANVYVLGRTTTMTEPASTGLLLLADTQDDAALGEVPFNSGLTTETADVAILLTGNRGLVATTAGITELPAGAVAVNEAGYTNAIEAAIPRGLLVLPGKPYKGKGKGGTNGQAFRDRLTLTAATGLVTGDAFTDTGLPANVANVAFRDEPVREWFDKAQALTLQTKNIDTFAQDIDIKALESGATETFVPGPGYHDRLFVSTESISRESGRNGVYQRYGVYIPTSYEPGTDVPMQWWLHWRGGTAHQAAHLTPRVFKHFGEDVDSIVVAPEGRGTSLWYVGKGHVDFLEVWKDAFDTFSVDANRVYVTGHSMGGFGTYLMTTLYPDRFAAGAPVAGPVTQGAWTGADFEGCDDYKYDDYTPCYIDANNSRPRDQHTRKLLENLRHVPLAILHGNLDELVPYSGVTRQAERLAELGYRFRMYSFPNYEHYSHPIVDQWAEAARYEHSFTRDPNPAHVTYKRDMPFERATESVQAEGLNLNFDFDSAYWMSHLTPTDPENGVASVDARSLAIPEPAHLTIPEAGGPAALGQTGPFVMKGLAWIADPLAAEAEAANAFEATLTGASSVRFDLARMEIDTALPVAGQMDTGEALELQLTGAWSAVPPVTIDGAPATATLVDGVLTIQVPAGISSLTIG